MALALEYFRSMPRYVGSRVAGRRLPGLVAGGFHPVIIDRFLAAYLPEAREGEPAPLALEYAFAPSLTDALRLLQEVVSETADGQGAALYIHDLDTGVTATQQMH